MQCSYEALKVAQMLDFVISFIFGLLMTFLHLFVDAGTEPRPQAPVENVSLPHPSLARSSFPTIAQSVPAPSQALTSTKVETPEVAAKPAEKEADAELFARLKKTNLNGPLKKQDLDDLDAFYEEVGSYVDPSELHEILEKNPKDLAELKKIVEENEEQKWQEGYKRERELTDSLKEVDLSGPLNAADMQKLWELSDINGYDLSPEEMQEVLATRPTSIEQFKLRADEIEDRYLD